MNYYVETHFYNHDGLVTSGGKGRDDYFEMMRRAGLKRITIPTVKNKDKIKAAERVALEVRLNKAWRRALKHLGRGDVLFIHQPPSEKFISFVHMITRVRNRGCRIVSVVFDLESYLKPYYGRLGSLKYQVSLLTEKAILKRSDAIIVHNDKMKEVVVSMGLDPDHIVCVGMMDYIRDCEPDINSIYKRMDKRRPIVFCGNLIPEKAGFLSDVPDNLRLDLYGPGSCVDETDNIKHKGIYPSIEIMDVISDSFGLVWDGGSATTPTEEGGSYLRINSPHKMALYLASGMPVIVWEESAMADIVIRENCGIAIASLNEINNKIERLTDEEYLEMVNNAIDIGRSLRKGVHIQAAVNKALGLIE